LARNAGINIRKQEGVACVLIKEKPADPRIIISIGIEARLNRPEAYVLYLALYKNIKDFIIKKNTKDPGYLDKIGDLPDRSYYKGLSYRASESRNDSKGPRKYKNCVSSEII
jgi:hypothetical protein